MWCLGGSLKNPIKRTEKRKEVMQKTKLSTPCLERESSPEPDALEIMARKVGIGFFRTHARRLLTEMLNLLFNHDLVFRLIGLLNRRLGFIQAVFLAYPANDAYRKAYTYP